MTDIDMLIHNLQSADLEQRYSAAKGLQDQAQLPTEAVKALQEAAADPEPLISVTADRALRMLEPEAAYSPFLVESEVDLEGAYTTQEILKGAALSVVILLLTIPLINIILDDRLNDLWFISLPAVLLAGYLASISFEDDGQPRLLAVLSSAAVGLLSGIIIYLLLSGLFLLAVSSYRGY